ncbi:peptide transporter, partial [Francisella tularensis subsp. holarctica]|nr:peptide transporter [Francisella tularensis subsp. holarctica]
LVLAIIGIIFFVSVVNGLLYFSSLIIIVLVLAVVMIVGSFINITFQQDKEYRLKMLLLLVVIFYATIFFMTYAQKSTSLFL